MCWEGGRDRRRMGVPRIAACCVRGRAGALVALRIKTRAQTLTFSYFCQKVAVCARVLGETVGVVQWRHGQKRASR